MALEKYRAKRRFAETPEPEGDKTAPPKSQREFCVQRHHASHLHYDLRLQVGGVMKSWAVPKGPTLDPNEKRLAMLVEDHPMEYADFEGTIPKGNYGAGSVMLWDRGTYELLGDATAEEQLARGDFKFRPVGKKLGGDFAIVRTKRGQGNEWLLIKKKDASAISGWDPEDHAASILTGRSQEQIADSLEASDAHAQRKRKFPKGAAVAAIPKIIAPMLAALGKGTPPAKGWLYEIKWDGVRAVCFADAGQVRILSRNGNDITRQYPEVAVLAHHLKCQQAIVDAEIAALDSEGRPHFEKLQHRMHLTDASVIARLTRSEPVVLLIFDLLYLDGHDLRGVPLAERKALLEEILTPNQVIRYSQHFETDGETMLAVAREKGLEGIVAKRATSHYESKRSNEWVKWKVNDTVSCVICGYTDGERDHFGALVLGVREDGKLKWAGNAGTGFDQKTMALLAERLAPLRTKERPLEADKGLPKKITWVRPELVCEVKYANWTSEGRLRAPVYLGLRDDVDTTPETHHPALFDASLKETTLTIDSHRLKFTNFDKPYYPRDGYVKRDLLNYYDAVAPLLLPHLKDRPLSLKRYPGGIDGQFFFQKQVAESFPSWLRTAMADGTRFVVGNDRATLLFLVNLGCIDHNPWMSRIGSLENPDYVLLDLDPHECGYEKIVEAALYVRAKLDRLEMESFPKTTGGDGMHIFIPLEPRYTYAQVRSFAEVLATLAAAERPDLFTTPRAVNKREKNKVYFDWQQIAEGKTISAPYVLRAYAGAPVATPLEWREVTPRLRPEQFHLRNVLARFDRVGDLFAGVLQRPQRLESAVENFSRLA